MKNPMSPWIHDEKYTAKHFTPVFDEFGLRSSVIQRPFHSKTAAYVEARVDHQ